MLDYYQLGFAQFAVELEKRGYNQQAPPPIRGSFWSIVPPGRYDYERGRELVSAYANRVEAELALVLKTHSLAYWLHAYRRIGPWYPAADPATIMLVRGIFEAAIQKYARLEPCEGVGVSTEIQPEAILNGQLVADRLTPLLDYLRQHQQLVLTRFGSNEMQELYDAERLCHELWMCSAKLRILGKQASLLVTNVSLRDDRSNELDALVTSYDRRAGRFEASASGTAFRQTEDILGWSVLASYNVNNIPMSDVASTIKAFTRKQVKGERFNFVWQPFDIASFYKAHSPFEDAFRIEKGVSFRDVMSVLAALGWRVFSSWQGGLAGLYRHWQRAYEGPYTWMEIRDEVRAFLPGGLVTLGLEVSAEDVDIDAALELLTLREQSRSSIDLMLVGPHCVLLPHGRERAFIDYAWIARLLYNLFFKVQLKDENFKGQALEEVVRRKPAPIPFSPCRGLDGQERQFDAAFSAGRVLVVVECRAFARSFGFERGDPRAIQYRTDRIDQALRDIDSKAMWLAARPIGANYSISAYDWIVPVAVTPFVEFIPSLASRWWLTEQLPRILTPDELEHAVVEGVFELPLLNAIPVGKG